MGRCISDKKLVELFKVMIKIRCFEEKAIETFKLGLIEGSVHPCIDQEAIATGFIASIREDDYVLSTHRGHGHLIAKGVDINAMMAELMMRTTGISKGRGGSMHMTDVKRGFLGTNGIVGGGLGLAVGVGFRNNYKATDRIVVCFFGDGAVNNGIFHESINMASIWKLPIIYVCENNMYSIATRIEDVCAGESIGQKRADAYGLAGEIIDGNDIFAVYKSAKRAVTRARSGNGPTLIECKTHRRTGHTIGDNMWYKSEEHIKEATEWYDPIDKLENYLLENKILNQEEIQKIKFKMEKMMDEAVEFGKNSELTTTENLDPYAFLNSGTFEEGNK